MRILITNDDGIHAPGLGALARGLATRGLDVVAVAPLGESSGSSAALGALEVGGKVHSERVVLEAAPEIEAHALDAPPAMCVLTGLTEAFGPIPHVVVSGLNDGHNLGRAVLHSGTVGAALTARMLNVPAVAISAPPRAVTHQALGGPDADRRAAELVSRLLSRLEHWPTAALNINLPLGEWTELRPGVLSPLGAVRLSVDGDHSVSVELETAVDGDDPAGTERWPTDAWLVAHGCASITPLSPVSVAATDGEVDQLASMVTFATR